MEKKFKFNLGDIVSHKVDSSYGKSKMLIIGRGFIETPYTIEEEYIVRAGQMGQISTARLHVFELESYVEKQ